MTEAPLLKHTAVLRDRLALDGARVVDVGCGSGALVRAMTRFGARAIGIEPGPAQLARARAEAVIADEVYVCALGEALPLPSASMDILIFFNALHHVPVAVQDAALAEAVRVLRPGGQLYVQEPLSEGAFFEMVRPIEDETEVCAAAYGALRRACAGSALEEQEEFVYRAPYRLASFETFRDDLIAVDLRRRPVVLAREESLRQSFMAAGEQRDDAFWFEIPSRLNLMQRL